MSISFLALSKSNPKRKCKGKCIFYVCPPTGDITYFFFSVPYLKHPLLYVVMKNAIFSNNAVFMIVNDHSKCHC